MITHFLGEEEVAGYAKDLARRLESLETNYPTIWVAIGLSGEKMATTVLDYVGDERERSVKVVRVTYNKQTEAVDFEDKLPRRIRGPVLLIDSTNHSGRSMMAVSDALMAKRLEVVSYSMVTKIGSQIIPSYFGVMIGYRDRVLFQLDVAPNNRLQRRPPYGVLRRLNADDVKRRYLRTGVASLDTQTYGDHFYDQEAEGAHVYVMLSKNKVLGLLKFKLKGTTLSISLVAAEEDQQGSGIGGALIRWAETWARNHNCKAVELWALEKRVGLYEHFGFARVGRQIGTGGGENYIHMHKSILYHIKPNFSLPDPWM